MLKKIEKKQVEKKIKTKPWKRQSVSQFTLCGLLFVAVVFRRETIELETCIDRSLQLEWTETDL